MQGLALERAWIVHSGSRPPAVDDRMAGRPLECFAKPETAD